MKLLTITLLASLLTSCATTPPTYEERMAAKAKQRAETKQWLADYYKEKRKDPEWVEFERRLERRKQLWKKHGIPRGTYYPQIPLGRAYRYNYY